MPKRCDFADYGEPPTRKRPNVCGKEGRPARGGTMRRHLCPEHFDRLKAKWPELVWDEERSEG